VAEVVRGAAGLREREIAFREGAVCSAGSRLLHAQRHGSASLCHFHPAPALRLARPGGYARSAMNAGAVSFLRGQLCVGLFALGLCGGCWAIRESLPFPEVPVVTPKLEQYEAHRDEYDTI